MFCFLTNSHGQDSRLMTVTLKPAKNSLSVSKFDTVYFKSGKSEVKKIYTNISTTDSILKLTDVAIGKYYVQFIATGFCLSWLDIAVCSKCDNQFQYWADIKNPDGKPCSNYFTSVTEMPQYKGGNTSLANDFQKAINKSDKKNLKKTSDFSLSFFVTKNKEVCDIFFSPNDLSDEIKAIVTKGIMKTTNWEIARQNGKPTDEIFTVDKQTLMQN